MYSPKGGYAAVSGPELAMFEKAGFVKIADPIAHAKSLEESAPAVDVATPDAEAPKRRGRPPKAA